jgi:hypothetical protein
LATANFVVADYGRLQEWDKSIFSALERAGFDLRYVPMNSLYKNKLMHDEMDIRPYL